MPPRWRSSATQTTHYWLSGSRVPDQDGKIYFDGLGPGLYTLALLGRPEDLRGSFSGLPGLFEVTYERPDVLLNPIRIRRELEPASGASFGPGGLPEARVPMAPDVSPAREIPSGGAEAAGLAQGFDDLNEMTRLQHAFPVGHQA